MILKKLWHWITGKKEPAMPPIKKSPTDNLQQDIKNLHNNSSSNTYSQENAYPESFEREEHSSGLLTGMLLGGLLNDALHSHQNEPPDNDFDFNDSFDDPFGGGSSGGGGADDSWGDDSDFND